MRSVMQPGLLSKAIPGIMPKMTVDEFRLVTGIESRLVAKKVLEFLAARGIGTVSHDTVSFERSDRLKAAVLAIQTGCDVEAVSELLSWRDFELLASEILNSFGYKVRTNVRFTKPRAEIDVVGVSSGFALAIDCKHWRRSSISSIYLYSRKQAARAELFLQRTEGVMSAVPVILTLHSEQVKFIDQVPVVPVSQFRSFVQDLRGFLQQVQVIAASRKN